MFDPEEILKRAERYVMVHSVIASAPADDLQIRATVYALCDELRAVLEPFVEMLASAQRAASAAGTT